MKIKIYIILNFLYCIMKSISFSITRQGADILLTPAKHTRTLIFLHGLGDSAEGYLPIFNSPMNPCDQNTKIVLLTAPVMPVTINMGMKMTSWYDIKGFKTDGDIEKTIGMDEVRSNAERINMCIAKEAEILGNDFTKVAVGGFSQGCAMALYCGLQYPKKIGAILGFSGYLFPNVTLSESNKETPLLLGHGGLDPLIPWSLAKNSYEKIKDRKITYVIDENLDHGFSDKSFKAFEEFWKNYIKQ